MEIRIRKVLYIEDDPEVQATMGAICDVIGDIELLIASSAHEGVAIYHDVTVAHHEGIELLIVDGHLPDANGWEIVDEIRRTYGMLPPVLAYPGDLSEALRDVWNKAGVTEILKKPADLDVLVATINRLAPRAAKEESA